MTQNGSPSHTIRNLLRTAPHARRERIEDVYHGVSVSDPFRWMEDDNHPDTIAWSEGQDKLSLHFLRHLPQWPRIESILAKHIKKTRYGAGFVRDGRFFYFESTAAQAHAVLYEIDPETGNRSIVLDPNTFSDDGSVSLAQVVPSHDCRHIAYCVSHFGSDWLQLRIKDMASGHDLPEKLERISFCSIAWKKDGSGFYYNRYRDRSLVSAEDNHNYNYVCFHRPGTAQADDDVIFNCPADKELDFFPRLVQEGRYLLLSVHRGTANNNGLYIRDEVRGGDFIHLYEPGEATLQAVGARDGFLYCLTNRDAPRGRLVRISLETNVSFEWETVIPEGPQILVQVQVVQSGFMAIVSQDATDRLRQYDRQGTVVLDVPLPDCISIEVLSGETLCDDVLITINSFLMGRSIYRYNARSTELRILASGAEPGAEDFEVRQIFVPSAESVDVPFFMIARRNIGRDGSHPVLMTGYGGFGISITPYFSPFHAAWLDLGGIVVVANLRGGNEYGESWHQAGMLDKKQNVYNDFLAVANWLIEQNYTNRSRLACHGGSNGGLLVAAVALQQPSTFAAVVCQVPVLDMLRYHRLLIGKYWVDEYGNADEFPDHFRFLLAYSPLHNVRKNIDYPPMLVVSADHDDRVAPAHAMKFVATMQSESNPVAPVLLKLEKSTGHGHGKTTSQLIEENADVIAFLCFALQWPAAATGETN